MRFLQPRKHRTFRPSYLATAGAMGIAVLVSIVQPNWLTALFLEVSGEMFAVHAAIVEGGNDVEARLMSKTELVAENAMLRDENMRLKLRAALYNEVVDERNRLYARFGNASTTAGILARVIAAPSRSPYDVILIDAGTEDGVETGDEAWVDTTLMLGIVESVSSGSARIRLFSSPGVETPFIVGTTTQASFTAIGSGGGMLEANLPKDVIVKEDDALMLPGEGYGTLGFVREVVARDADSFQMVRAILPINLFETREVLIRPASASSL